MQRSYQFCSIGKLGHIRRNVLNAKDTTYRAISTLDKLYPRHDDFSQRHIGPSEEEKRSMLDLLGFKVIMKNHSYYTTHLENNREPFMHLTTSSWLVHSHRDSDNYFWQICTLGQWHSLKGERDHRNGWHPTRIDFQMITCERKVSLKLGVVWYMYFMNIYI